MKRLLGVETRTRVRGYISSMTLDCSEDICYGSTALEGWESPVELVALRADGFFFHVKNK